MAKRKRESAGSASQRRCNHRQTQEPIPIVLPSTPSRSTTPAAITPDQPTRTHNNSSREQPTIKLASFDLPSRFSLSQSICSYGYFGLAPNTWTPAPENEIDDDAGVYMRPVVYGTRHNEEYATIVRVEQQTRSNKLMLTIVGGDIPQTSEHRLQVVSAIRRTVRLDWSPEEFWSLHSEAKARGYGRTFRSPTLWEDLVKTLTNCNMQWSGTAQMNKQLCAMAGHKCSDTVGVVAAAFPTPRQILDKGDDYLKANCRLGYRTPWLVELAAKFVSGEVDALTLEDSSIPNDAIFKSLNSLKGFGKFASYNVMQMLGRHDVFPYDTETTRLFREEFNVPKSTPVGKVHRQARDHYAPFAPYQFLAYWFDLWRNYERRRSLPSPRWTTEACLSL